MANSQRISNPRLSLWLVVIAGVLVIVTTVWVGWQLRPTRTLERKQEALVRGIEKRSASRITRLVSVDYSDRWGFDHDDAIEAVLDVGSQYLTLVVRSEDTNLSLDGEWGVVRTHLRVSGRPIGPVGNEATRRINQLQEPFEFTWKRESFLPTSWKLMMIENSELPEELFGYKPGDIQRAMQGE